MSQPQQDEVQELKKQIAVMKQKTKDFIVKLQQDHADALAAKDSSNIAELQAKEVIITELRAKETTLAAEVKGLQGKLQQAEGELKGQSHELDEQSEVIEGLEEEIRALQEQLAKDEKDEKVEDKDKELMLVSPSHDASVASPAAPAAATVNLLDVEEISIASAPSLAPARLPTTDVTSEPGNRSTASRKPWHRKIWWIGS